MKKALNIISQVLVWVLVIVSVAVMIFTIISVNTFDRRDRDVFGYRAFIVLSDSMSKTDFDAGDLVIVKKTDPLQLKEGDIIAFTSQDPASFGKTVTHKIRTVTATDEGMLAFVTYGTTTDTNDETLVTAPYILGQYQFSLPKVGLFFDFLKSPTGYIVCILIPFLLLIGYQGVNCVRLFRRYKAEQMAELQAEKDAIAAERKKSEEMMAALLEMKAQMEKKPEEGPKEEPKAETDEVAAMKAQLAALQQQLEKAQKAADEKAEEEEV